MNNHKKKPALSRFFLRFDDDGFCCKGSRKTKVLRGIYLFSGESGEIYILVNYISKLYDFFLGSWWGVGGEFGYIFGEYGFAPQNAPQQLPIKKHPIRRYRPRTARAPDSSPDSPDSEIYPPLNFAHILINRTALPHKPSPAGYRHTIKSNAAWCFHLDDTMNTMTYLERMKVKNCLLYDQPLPADLKQKLLIELGNGADISGKKSLTYQESKCRRDMYLQAAFKALDGRPWTRCNALANRLVLEDYGRDEAGIWLKRAVETRHKIPVSVAQIHNICCE